MPIFIDKRTEASIYGPLLRKRHLDVKEEYLKSGDFAFGEVGIERKTVQNLLSSLFTKEKGCVRQLWSQLANLRNTYSIPILLIEGEVDWKDPTERGIMSSIYLRWKQPVIMSLGTKETVDIIEALFIKYGKALSDRPLPAAVYKYLRPDQIQLAMLQCIVGIGPVMAKKILDSIDFHDLFMLKDGIELTKVMGKDLSIEKAERIVEVFR